MVDLLVSALCPIPLLLPDNAATIDYVLDRARSAGHCRVYPSGACTMGLKGESLAEIGDMAAHGAVAFTDDGRGDAERWPDASCYGLREDVQLRGYEPLSG